MSMCTNKLHRWNVPQNNVWKIGMCPFLTSLMLECVLNCKTLHECALLESNVIVVLSWWTNETKLSPKKKRCYMPHFENVRNACKTLFISEWGL
jgi:hypothetical protein